MNLEDYLSKTRTIITSSSLYEELKEEFKDDSPKDSISSIAIIPSAMLPEGHYALVGEKETLIVYPDGKWTVIESRNFGLEPP